MKKVVEFLTTNPVQYLATVGRDGKAKCRPFMFCFEQDGKLWFCTNNQKDVYKDMQANPYVEVTVSSPSYTWIRLHGKVVFENNRTVKEGCIQQTLGGLEPSVGRLHGIHGNLPTTPLLKRTGDFSLGAQNTNAAVRQTPFFCGLLHSHKHDHHSNPKKVYHRCGTTSMTSE